MSSTSQTGVTTKCGYDAFERETSVTDGRGNTTRTVYDAFGRIASSIDALGYSTAYGYDALGRQVSVTDPLGHTVTTAYDPEGHVISQRGATYPVDYFYDEFGDKISMTTYRDINAAGDVTRWLRDEATGLVTNKVYADGKGPRYDYTPDGKLATRTWARGIVTTYSYDDNGALTNTVYSDGAPTISLAYNRAGRQVRAHDAAGVTIFLYDGFGAVTNETVLGVVGTNTIERFYDSFGRSLGYALNGIRQSTLAYDPATGRLASMQIPAIEDRHIIPMFGHTFNKDSWVLDARKFYFNDKDVNSAYMPSDSWTSSFIGHDDNLGANFCVPRAYVLPDDVDYIVELYRPGVVYSGAIAEAIAFQVVGAAGTNTIIRHWDNFGRNAGYALNGTRQSTLAYDPATGRLATMHANGSDTPFAWNYLSGSDLKSSLAYPNGLTASWNYDANNRLLQVCNANPTNVISQYDYTYDAAGRRVACGKSGSAFAQNDTLSYGYNEKSELTNAVAAVDSDYRYSYDFDDIGNRETSSERGTNSVYAANQLNQYTEISDSALSASPRETFTPQFDDDGNQTLIKTSTGIWSVTYNGENRPIQWTLVNSSTPNSSTPTLLSMSYDRMGRRVTKNDQRFVYDGYLQITDNSGNTYIWDSSEPVATRPLVWNHSALNYYTHDGNKNVSEVIASNNDVAAHYEYAPFGALTVSCGVSAAANHWCLSSEYAEDDTATIYYNFRHYISTIGRWATREPMLDLSYRRLRDLYMPKPDDVLERSLYLFAMNSPLTTIDVGGLFPSGENYGWGSMGTSRGNCWRYACNDPANAGEPHSPKPPGERYGPFRPEVLRFSCDSIKEGMLAKYSGKVSVVPGNQACPKCHYKVLLVLRPVSLSKDLPRDYHWYRQDTDDNCNPMGTWSHKPGYTSVQTGVIDPVADASKRHYGKQCPFFFCFPCAKNGSPSLDVD